MQWVLIHRFKGPACVLGLTLLLLLTLKTESIWTDEAFSAFLACQKSFSSLKQMLLAGDSSDLQMWLYYTYLHLWVQLFGASEIALRAANIPFLIIYSSAIVWISHNLFRSDWVWLASLSPFAWAYASDARPYMVIIALSTVFFASVFAALTNPRFANSSILPWVALVSLWIGMNMHMLIILLLPPSIVFIFIYCWRSGCGLSAGSWLRPALVLSPLYLCFFAYLVWTFQRGTSYDYAHPDLLSMASVLFRFAGLAGFAPNRHYDVPLTNYLFGMISASVVMLTAVGLSIWPILRAGQPKTLSLFLALVTGLCEALALSFIFKQQIEVRHLACLFVLVVFLLFSAWESRPEMLGAKSRAMAVLAIALVWLVSDARMTFLAEYRREDFRAAVAETVGLARDRPAEIAVVADPAAVAFYGLTVRSTASCFPLPGPCQTALATVPWPRLATAQHATFWTSLQISDWLAAKGAGHRHQIVLISRSRHPMYLQSPWWSALSKTGALPVYAVHGFFVYDLSD